MVYLPMRGDTNTIYLINQDVITYLPQYLTNNNN